MIPGRCGECFKPLTGKERWHRTHEGAGGIWRFCSKECAVNHRRNWRECVKAAIFDFCSACGSGHGCECQLECEERIPRMAHPEAWP